MIRTFIWFFYFGFYLIIILPRLGYAKYLDMRGKVKERDELARRTARSWARTLVWLSGTRVTVIGEENIPRNSEAVFIGNHQGNFDIPLLLGFVDKPLGFIAKIEILKMPVISTWMKYLYCVFMDRNDIRQSVAAINEGIDNLKKGHSIVIFPEGTRSKGNEMGEFKQGSFKLATKAEAPIVPVTMKGSYKIYEGNNGRIKPASVEIIIAPPIETKGLSAEELKQLPDRVRNIIIENLK